MLSQRCIALWMAVLAAACSCSTASNKPASPPPAAPSPDPLGFDLSGIDRSADPCRDFYAYACGSWLASHPIPADKPRVSRYDEMIDRNEAWTREILEGAADDRHARSPVEKQVGDDYASCLDQQAVDGRGLSPLTEEFAAIDAAVGSANWTAIFARFT